MGCHTWFFRKENRTIEEARSIYTDLLKKTITTWKRMLVNKDDEMRISYKYNDEDLTWQIDVMERMLRMIDKGLCNVAVMNKQPELSYFLKDKGFFISDDLMPHDVFRIGNYPADRLFSLEETLNFMEINKEKIYRGDLNHTNRDNHQINYETVKNNLEKFWKEYPDGMIKFG